MESFSTEKSLPLGPFEPTVILHGGAGSISRASLPPELWDRYRSSLLKYLTDARKLLESGASALDAACVAATWFEDDPLFNCGRGSVFTEQGTIEMEASVMVCSLDRAGPGAGRIKRGAAVSLVQNTRHPILLAKEVLLAADEDRGTSGSSTLHCHLSGLDVEQWGWEEKALEKKTDRWFWTRKRQGTVGAVCLDAWGNLAVATSTGGLTNKKVGRIGDTPTIGSGFWAESWEENAPAAIPALMSPRSEEQTSAPMINQLLAQAGGMLASCLHLFETEGRHRRLQDPPPYSPTPAPLSHRFHSPEFLHHPGASVIQKRRRAVAMSGTGNGDSFLRTNAARTVAAMCRFSNGTSLAQALTSVAGPGGELQQSAGDRWGHTGEGEGGIIGIEIVDLESGQARGDHKDRLRKKRGKAVFDFNCGGLFRAFYEADDNTGQETPRAMVFKEEY
ncbi:hypothetical protein LTR40_006235 [Exophiala xenobiotica]|nr:hypothetical protein LTR40_006235 [Exophiala xenobiotica]